MEEANGYQVKLEAALEKKAQFLEEKYLPRLMKNFRVFQTFFENIYNILLRKALVQEDPYKYDQKITEVTVPPQGNFMESEKQEKISQRLSEFHSQLDFLNNYYQFSLEFLTLDRIKRIVGLVQYINWLRLIETSTNITTVALAQELNKIRQGSDKLAAGIINDSTVQIGTNVKQILTMLKEIAFYLRETYKLELRRDVISRLPDLANKEEAVNKIKRLFRQEKGDKPFFPELVEEVLAEDYSDNRQELRAEVLSKLSVQEVKKKVSQEGHTYKTILLESIRLLASTGSYLNDSLKKLTDNNLILLNRKQSFGEKFKQWLQKVAQKGEPSQIIDVEYFDSISSATRIEKLDFKLFLEDTQQKARLFSAIYNKMSTAYLRLESASEDQIFKFLDINLKELHLIYRRLEGLNTYFRSEAPTEERGRIKGIKIELSSMKNSLVKSNQKKHEYVALKEEERQMKKLGIKMEND